MSEVHSNDPFGLLGEVLNGIKVKPLLLIKYILSTCFITRQNIHEQIDNCFREKQWQFQDMILRGRGA